LRTYDYRKRYRYIIFICLVYYWDVIYRCRNSIFRYWYHRVNMYSFLPHKDRIFYIKEDASGEFLKLRDVGDSFSVPVQVGHWGQSYCPIPLKKATPSLRARCCLFYHFFNWDTFTVPNVPLHPQCPTSHITLSQSHS